MLLRHSRGVLDFAVAVLCLWGAAYHTPGGQLVRGLAGRVLGLPVSERPLLAYYSNGSYGIGQLVAPGIGPLAPLGEVPPHDALGLGVYAIWQQLPAAVREERMRGAARYGIDVSRMDHAREGPKEASRWVQLAAQSFRSEEAAMVAIFVGHEPARYASDRVRAQGGNPDLQALARQLPPGFEDRIGYASRALSLGTAYGLGWPVGPGTPVSSSFGPRLHPVLGVERLHTGIDLAVPVGTRVTAAAAGVVRRASEDRVNGRVLLVDHGRGVTTAYAHNSTLLVRVGQTVERGQLVALSGNTGRSTGPHLHYQLELWGRPIDPLLFRRLQRPALEVNGGAPKPSPTFAEVHDKVATVIHPGHESVGESSSNPAEH